MKVVVFAPAPTLARGRRGRVAQGPAQGDRPESTPIGHPAVQSGVFEAVIGGGRPYAVAAFIRESGQVNTFGASFTSSQGAVVGRIGKLSIDFVEGDVIRVGGESVTCIDGTITW